MGGHLMRRVDLLEKALMLGKIEGRRRRGRQRMRWLEGITDSMDMALEAAQGAPRDPRRDSRGERSPWLPLEITSGSRLVLWEVDGASQACV